MSYSQKISMMKWGLGLLLVLGAIIFIIVIVFNRVAAVNLIEKDGVYVVGKNTSSSRRKNGRSFIFTYVYNGKEFETVIKGLSNSYKLGELIFVRISSSDPSKNMRGDYPRPGPCITFENAPAEGWKEIPVCK